MCCIDIDQSATSGFWLPQQPLEISPTTAPIWRQDIWATVETEIYSLGADLQDLSLDIHSHPELGFEEHYAHDVLTKFMRIHGFRVVEHHILPTAWEATFTHGKGGRTLGINSEMDALPSIGHACGHNLIAISGVAIACAMKAALVQHNIPGTIVLLGTPAEENGAGKQILLDAGAYKHMDSCIMCHPAPGPNSASALLNSLTRQEIEVEYFGRSAHAGQNPWEGQNALDSSVCAYNSVSVLRQQLHPTIRVQGTFTGHDWTPNVIPDNSKMIWYVRAPSWKAAQEVVKRMIACFEAAALATGCRVKIDLKENTAYYDLNQNAALADAFETMFKAKCGNMYTMVMGASTDFGNVTYALPGLHPIFAIPTVPNGGNHTPAFTEAAKSPEAHKACLNVSKVLAAIGIRVLLDDKFFEKVKRTFQDTRRQV